MAQRARTAGLVVVGDEVLSGAVADANAHFVSQRLHALGVRLLRVSVVPDDVDAIADEVREFSGRFDLVLTAGGVGPTHDDRTYEAVAQALGLPLRLDAEVAEAVAPGCGPDADPARAPALKMALLPAPCTLHRVPDVRGTTISKPIVQAGNVFMFPGSPANLRRAFAHLEAELRGDSAVRFHCRAVRLHAEEAAIVGPLNEAVAQFKDAVAFGSYPNCGAWAFPTKLTLESTSWPALHAATAFLLDRLPPGWVRDLSPVPMESLRQFAAAAEDPAFKKAVVDALQVLDECCDRYSPDQLVLCFNGGKDATVLLHLAAAAIRHRHPEHAGPLNAFWVHSAEPFPEVRDFVARMVEEYDLSVEELPGPIKVGLEKYLSGKPQIKAALIGVRRTDPYSASLSAFQVTDEGWPPVMRVSPILDWRYADVWTFLRELRLPYCSLYDQGYTSLGNPNNTRRNPTLRTVDEAGVERFKPAWQLEDASTERDGRC